MEENNEMKKIAACGCDGKAETMPMPQNEVLVGGFEANDVYKIKKLTNEKEKLLYIKEEQTVYEAVTLMLANDYSQLPVMSNKLNGKTMEPRVQSVKGLISWKTIGSRMALMGNNNREKVSDYMVPVRVFSDEESVFQVVNEIVRNECILVKNEKNIVYEILTTSDLSRQFGVLSRPFLMIGQIEDYLRKLLDNRFSKKDLVECSNQYAGRKEIETISDLTFGEYIRVLENRKRWETLQLKIDRKIFLEDLKEIKSIRNRVMHFEPSGLEEKELQKLVKICDFLRDLDRCGALDSNNGKN